MEKIRRTAGFRLVLFLVLILLLSSSAISCAKGPGNKASENPVSAPAGDLPALANDLRDGNGEVRQKALEALVNNGSEKAVNALAEVLTDADNIDLSNDLAQALGQIGGEPAVQALTMALQSGYSEIQTAAAAALGEIGSESAVKALTDALKDDGYDRPSAAAAALGKIGSPVAIDALIKALNHKENIVRSNAAEALGEIGGESIVEPLKTALSDEYYVVRYTAADALGKTGSEDAVPALISALHDEDQFVREHAAYALGKIGSKSAVGPLITALDDQQDTVRAAVAIALGDIGAEGAEIDATVTKLIAKLQDKSLDVWARSSAVFALSRIGQESAVGPLIEALGDEYMISSTAAYALGRIGNEAAINALLAALQVEGSDIVQDVMNALGATKSEAGLDTLIAILQDESCDSGRRGEAAYAIGATGSERAIQALKDAYYKYNIIRYQICYGLGNAGNESAARVLIAILQDKDEWYTDRGNAAASLGRIGGESAADALITVMRDGSDVDEARIFAAKALGTIALGGNKKAVTALKEEFDKGVLRSIAGAYAYFLISGETGTENRLIDALNQYGDTFMAQDFLNCSNEQLESAARRWASDHGVEIVNDSNSYFGGPIQWGGR